MFVLPSQLESIARRIVFCHCEARRAEAISSAHAISVDYVTWGCKPNEVWLLLRGPERPPLGLDLNPNQRVVQGQVRPGTLLSSLNAAHPASVVVGCKASNPHFPLPGERVG